MNNRPRPPVLKLLDKLLEAEDLCAEINCKSEAFGSADLYLGHVIHYLRSSDIYKEAIKHDERIKND
jgi:hypothetical protein